MNQKLMDNLVAQYGAKRGKSVYYAMESEGRTGSGPQKVAPKKAPGKIKRPGK